MGKIKDYCLSSATIGYWNCCGGVELKGVAYGDTDYAYCVSGAGCDCPKYHRLKVYYTSRGGYIRFHSCKLYLQDGLRAL